MTRYSEVQEMQYKLLQKELRSTEATLGIRQKILESSLGHNPHHTAAITLVFEGLALSAQDALISFSTAITTRPIPGSYGLPGFEPFHGKDPTNSNLTLSYQSISFMPQYLSLSHEVGPLKCWIPFGLKYGIAGDQGPPLLWDAHPTSVKNTLLCSKVLLPLVYLLLVVYLVL